MSKKRKEYSISIPGEKKGKKLPSLIKFFNDNNIEFDPCLVFNSCALVALTKSQATMVSKKGYIIEEEKTPEPVHS